MLRPPYHLHLPFLLLLLSLPPSLAAGGPAASNVDTVGFWLGFTLLVVVSSVEAAMSIIWMCIRVSSFRVCGREVELTTAIDSEEETDDGNGKAETAVDMFSSISLVPYLMVRKFNPATSLEAPAGLVDSVRVFFKPGDSTVGLRMEHGVHVIVGLLDVSLGVAGLVLNPGSPEALYTALKDPKAPLTFENYSTLFLLYWLLGAVLLICMLPTRSERLSVQILGLPGSIAYVVACLVSVVLFALGCWKIDVARKAHEEWTPMLSYWIGGAAAVNLQCGPLEIFHIFGLVGLVFMLKHTF